MRIQYILDVPNKGASKTPPLYAGRDVHQLVSRIVRFFKDTDEPSSGRKILVLEGPAASGKSILAQRLSLALEAPLVSMDDFFLPFDMRTEDRFREVGGNIHYERFAEEIIAPATASQDGFYYRPFDCQTGQYASPIEVQSSPFLIVEGVYSLHQRFRHYWTTALLLGVDLGLQRERILQRETAAGARNYFDRWLPLEKPYFQDPKLQERVDLNLMSSMSKTEV